MRFLPTGRKTAPGDDETTNLSIPPSTTSKHNGTTKPTKPTAPLVEKPLPTRTTSTRFQDPVIPTRTPSQAKHPTRTPSQTHHHRPSKKSDHRPPLQPRRTTAQTRYIDMLLALDTIPRWHNLLASFFTWILLAGYIVFPATFSSFQKDRLSSMEAGARNRIEKQILGTVRNTPLLYVAGLCCGVGVLGCIGLWWRWRGNYVWVIQRLLLPCLLNSVAGLLSTVVNVYSARDGQYSVTAKATLVVTSVCSVVTAILFLLYNTFMLGLVKRRHERETRDLERSMSQTDRRVEGGANGVILGELVQND